MLIKQEVFRYYALKLCGLFVDAKKIVYTIFFAHLLASAICILFALWKLFAYYITIGNEGVVDWITFTKELDFYFICTLISFFIFKFLCSCSIFYRSLNVSQTCRALMFLDANFNIFGNTFSMYLFKTSQVKEFKPEVDYEALKKLHKKFGQHTFGKILDNKPLLEINRLVFFYHGASRYDQITHYLLKKINPSWYEHHMKVKNAHNDDELDIKRQQNFAVLNDIDLTLKPGKFIVFLGNNGSGKSTLIKIVTKLVNTYSGNVFWVGKHAKEINIKSFAQNVAYVPQQSIFYANINLFDFVSQGLYPKKSYWEKMNKKDEVYILNALNELNIAHLTDKLISELSGGEKQKAIIARALVQQSKVIILDEPTTFLDIYTQYLILDLFKKVQKNHQITIMMILHDLKQAKLYADEVVLIDRGTIYKYGNAKDILNMSEVRNMYG